MAFKARLDFSGEKYDVQQYVCFSDRNIDSKGRPPSSAFKIIDIKSENPYLNKALIKLTQKTFL